MKNDLNDLSKLIEKVNKKGNESIGKLTDITTHLPKNKELNEMMVEVLKGGYKSTSVDSILTASLLNAALTQKKFTFFFSKKLAMDIFFNDKNVKKKFKKKVVFDGPNWGYTFMSITKGVFPILEQGHDVIKRVMYVMTINDSVISALNLNSVLDISAQRDAILLERLSYIEKGLKKTSTKTTTILDTKTTLEAPEKETENTKLLAELEEIEPSQFHKSMVDTCISQLKSGNGVSKKQLEVLKRLIATSPKNKDVQSKNRIEQLETTVSSMTINEKIDKIKEFIKNEYQKTFNIEYSPLFKNEERTANYDKKDDWIPMQVYDGENFWQLDSSGLRQVSGYTRRFPGPDSFFFGNKFILWEDAESIINDILTEKLPVLIKAEVANKHLWIENERKRIQNVTNKLNGKPLDEGTPVENENMAEVLEFHKKMLEDIEKKRNSRQSSLHVVKEEIPQKEREMSKTEVKSLELLISNIQNMMEKESIALKENAKRLAEKSVNLTLINNTDTENK